jgi:hypothetical protein
MKSGAIQLTLSFFTRDALRPFAGELAGDLKAYGRKK